MIDDAMTSGSDFDSALYVRREDVFFTIVGDELIVMDDAEEKFFTSNAVAAAIWEMLEHPADLNQLSTKLMASFSGAEHDQVRADVREFLVTLRERGLVRDAA